MKRIEKLIKLFSILPGIGRKSATRIVYYLLQSDEDYVESLADGVSRIKKEIRSCSICGNYTDKEPCEICTDMRRNKKIICIVENPQDIMVIESTKEYNGVYHVLNGVISPIDGIGPEDLSLDRLKERVEKNEASELIIATNPTVEGDTTALYIAKLFEKSDINITRLALGLPVGGDIEYADRLTLSRSFKGRTSISKEA